MLLIFTKRILRYKMMYFPFDVNGMFRLEVYPPGTINLINFTPDFLAWLYLIGAIISGMKKVLLSVHIYQDKIPVSILKLDKLMNDERKPLPLSKLYFT